MRPRDRAPGFQWLRALSPPRSIADEACCASAMPGVRVRTRAVRWTFRGALLAEARHTCRTSAPGPPHAVGPCQSYERAFRTAIRDIDAVRTVTRDRCGKGKSREGSHWLGDPK